MADSINDGGPAFPHPGGASDSTVQESHLGLSLRDWFAGQALTGIVSHDSSVSPDLLKMFGCDGKTRGDVAAIAAYAFADAMLKARESKS